MAGIAAMGSRAVVWKAAAAFSILSWAHESLKTAVQQELSPSRSLLLHTVVSSLRCLEHVGNLPIAFKTDAVLKTNGGYTEDNDLI